MNRTPLLLPMLLFLGCSPENAQENLTNAPVGEVAAANEQVVDSVSNTRIDGTATTTLSVDVKQQLPAELEVHLDRTHGLWQLPTLITPEIVPAAEQGPYFLQADFNSDKQLDYAIQLMERDSAFVYVFVKNGPDEFQEHLLERHRLYAIEGKKRSTHSLALVPKAATLLNETTLKKVVLAQDGIAVGTANATVTYVWEKEKFRKIETKTER